MVRVREDRPAPDRVLEVLRRPGLLVIGGVMADVGEELPTVEPELVDDLPKLRRLLAEPFGDDEARPSTDPVRGNAGQVPERADLRVAFGRLSRDRHGNVADYEVDLLRGGNVLEMLMVLVERNLLLVAPHLVGLRMEGGQAEVPTDDVGKQHAQGLSGTACGPDRTRVVELDVRAVLPVLMDVDLGQPLERSDEDPLGQDREADPERGVHARCHRIAPGRVACDPAGDGQRDLLARHGSGERADLGRDPFDPEVGEEFLDAHRHVLGTRDLGSDLGVVAGVTGLLRDYVRAVDLGLDRPKIRLHERARECAVINSRAPVAPPRRAERRIACGRASGPKGRSFLAQFPDRLERPGPAPVGIGPGEVRRPATWGWARLHQSLHAETVLPE